MTTKIKTLPSWAPMAGWAFAGRVWVREGVRDREGIIAHEMVHVDQQRRDGIWKFHWRYVVSKKWRLAYEAEAYALDVSTGRRTFEWAARSLSSKLYLNMCTFEEARDALLRWM
jgi:hypothetical protein